MPLIIGIRVPKAYHFSFLLVLYWILKAVLPLGMFNAPSALLVDLGFWAEGWGSLLVLMAISALALVLALSGRKSDAIRHATYFLTDGLLTCAIFFASVE